MRLDSVTKTLAPDLVCLALKKVLARMNTETARWVAATLLALIVGAYGYAKSIEASVESRIEKSEARLFSRLDRIESKLDHLYERRER